MHFVGFSSGLLGFGRNQLKPRKPNEYFKGKCLKDRFFEFSVARSGPALVLLLFVWGFFVPGTGEDLPMVSIPLGFEISGYETRHWVSENGVFAFGFLPDIRKGDGFVVGIWYNFKGRGGAEMLPVWTVGGDVTVSENSTFRLSMEGSLVLFDNPSGLLVWSSNTGSLGVEEASLLDNGNLILKGSGQKVVWESFDSPTDTLLPGQSFHFPQTLQAPSAYSISGYYSFAIRGSGDIALLWDNNVTYWSSHLGPTVSAVEARFQSDGILGLFDRNGSLIWYRSSKDVNDSSVVFRHLRIDADGNLRIYSWDAVLHTWKVVWQAVENQCNVFGSCGLYSLCGYNSTGPVCDCLVMDSLSSAAVTESDNGPFGCKKMADLSNCKMGISMFVLKKTVLYGLYPPHDVDTMLSADACREYCLNDISCYAATARNDGSGLCTIKKTSFISGYRYASVSATSYLKVCLVPQAVSAVGDSHNNPSLTPLSKQQSGSPVDGRKHFVIAIAVLFLSTALVFLAMEILVFWFVYRRREIKAQKRVPFQKDAFLNPHCSALIRLSFEEVKELMKDFMDQIGTTVFRGVLPNRISLVAKVLKNVASSERDFRMAVSTLGSTHHRNLVALKGYCFEPKHKILLYEYINNGSLSEWLLRTKRNQNQGTWQQRLDIAIGVARAIAYLHLECQQCIAHGNLKLENVLLDEQLVAKVTDFGLHCLLEKEAASSSESLPQRDVYMFGEMLLQIVRGKRDANAYPLVHKICQNGNLFELIDNQLEGEVELEGVERAVRIALWCMQEQPFLRPSIGEVVKVLEGTLQVDTPPASGAFCKKENQMAEGDADVIEAIS